MEQLPLFILGMIVLYLAIRTIPGRWCGSRHFETPRADEDQRGREDGQLTAQMGVEQ